MKVKVSDKFQVVIPKEARKKMHLKRGTSYMMVKKVSPGEITYSLLPNSKDSIEKYAGALKNDWGKNPVEKLRKVRDTDWD